jgi:isocitrate dehydrogenase
MADKLYPDLIYTKVDEAPELASASLLPIINRFVRAAGLTVGRRDISLAGRVIAAFPDYLTDAQCQSDDLAELGERVKTPDANVVKLPNISASIPQLVACINELQAQGYNLPDYPIAPENDEEQAIAARYDAIKGSAVNPILREGNSDRRSAPAVKIYAQNNPHTMGLWDSESKTHVSAMSSGDFISNEKSATLTATQAGIARIEFEDENGRITILKDGLNVKAGTVVDASFMSVRALRAFLREQLAEAKQMGILFSVHLKATMMKVSDPIIFGHAVAILLEDFTEKHGTILDELGVDYKLGLNDLEARIATLRGTTRRELEANLIRCFEKNPPLYMVNSDKGLSNFHVSSDVIIDASMPALIRAGGKGWGPDGVAQDCKCVIPDNSYAPIYDETIKFFKENGSLDPKSAGSVSNVGLMAQKAEEYGSHPTTFQMADAGVVRYILANGDVLHEHHVEKGDIWRSSSTNKAPIEDWVRLGLARQRATGAEAVFWLNKDRPHDAEIIVYVKAILDQLGVAESSVKIMAPRAATRFSLETITAGKDCISITGNVLRDYLTDLFPILELGTSAKMLSVVKLMNGGAMFETGAGGSAPKHVQQLIADGHLRWDSLGEFCALGESLNFISDSLGNKKAGVLGKAVDKATQIVLENDKSPVREVGQTDTRDSHFYFALYWAQALASQTEDKELADHFSKLAVNLGENETKIVAELAATQGKPCDLGGYYHAADDKVENVMRPSATLNSIIG